MKVAKAGTETHSRTPQACDRCRKSKVKCSGTRPNCRNCLKRKKGCTWPSTPAPGGYYQILDYAEVESGTDRRVLKGAGPILDGPVRGDCNSACVLPEAHLLQLLLGIFLARHHDGELCSFLHKPSLDMSVLAVRSPFLVMSIISLSALYIPDDEALRDFGFEAVALSDNYARSARRYAQRLSDEPSVYNIQAFLVLAIRELITWTNLKAWMYAGTAIRMSQALHLGLEFNQHSPGQKEVRRRTFWACFVVDRLISYSCNHPFAINQMSALIQLPCPENSFAFEEDYSGPSLDNILQHTNQLSQLGITPFYITMLQLWGNMATLHTSGGRRSSKYAPTDPEGEFYKTAKAIDNFAAALPPSLRWSPQNYKLHQVTGQAQAFVNLNLLLFHSRCVMHQEYLPQLDSQYSLATLQVDEAASYDAAGLSLDYSDAPIIECCIDSVHALTDMATMLTQGTEQDQQLLQSPFAANALMTSAAVHLWILYTQTCDKCPKDVAEVNFAKLLDIIRSWQSRWRVACAWAETLEMLRNLYSFSYGTAVTVDFDYWETGTDEITDSPTLVEEAGDANGAHTGLSDGDGIVDPSAIAQRLHDKVKGIMLNPLYATDVKKHNLRVYCRTVWQHMWNMWSFEPLESFDSDLIIQ
ncbi:hypothetical protein VE01_05786 [Pseudogymnoascus verrucosus]|uniref:Zn(2)-C6 fungal-type domain-containing protein n=1 Tax=Pseudogymnoascus verrucosus TaxID=342668 RepID=A0A1B8GK52_9PEZI|nr:uncharacterized protein VE01_05786 [Pseudogymnoascus verrucosus]OBT96227.2 hypothetical protein VE01_05786 [Pseudogymnoascus verrucosus]